MASTDGGRGVRRVRCPRCSSVLEEPSAPVYQCGGCGTSLRAKNQVRDAAGASSSGTGALSLQSSRHPGSRDVASTSRSTTPTPDAGSSSPRATDTPTGRRDSGDLVVSVRKHVSGDVASTSRSSTPDASASGWHRATDTTTGRRDSRDLVASARKQRSGDVASTSSSSTPDATSSRRQTTGTMGRRDSGDPTAPARNHVFEQVRLIETRAHDQSADQAVHDTSEALRQRDAERAVGSPPGVSAPFPRGYKDAAPELQDDSVKSGKGQAELHDSARKKHSGEAAAAPRSGDRQEFAPRPAESQPARDGAGGKAPSPAHPELDAEDLAPLRQKILKTVDDLKDDLAELFRKSPEADPATRARRRRLPKQEAVAPSVAAGARHAVASAKRPGGAARAGKHGQVALPPPRGLPSRRYRRCRADPCRDNVQPRSCHHGCCCRHHGRPECGRCRGHCCRPRAQAPATRKPAAADQAKRRPTPRHHCRPVLKGAPFIVCSTCFKLVQVPADFAVSTKTVRKLRCGSCSAVLSYSYRDPARKKPQDCIDSFSTDGSEVHDGASPARPDPFAPFVDGFGLSSHSTEDERLHVSRNPSFDTVDEMNGMGRLHRLMGYASASELLRLRQSPDLYESFRERTTPDAAHYDRKGKGVCVDADDDEVDDSDEEDGGALKRSAARGSVCPIQLPGMFGNGIPIPGRGGIRIKS